MTWAELCEQMATARSDLPVRVRLGNGKLADVTEVEFRDEFVPMDKPLAENDPRWIDLEKAGAQPWERTQDHQVTAVVLRVG
jgi:hypothetical protein